MELAPVTKIDKENTTTSKKIDDDVISKNCDVIAIFQFTANLEQSGSRISDVQSVKCIFSLKVTFYLTKTENKTKKSLTQPSHNCFE